MGDEETREVCKVWVGAGSEACCVVAHGRAPAGLTGVACLGSRAAGNAALCSTLRRLELSASHLGDLAGLAALPGLVQGISRSGRNSPGVEETVLG